MNNKIWMIYVEGHSMPTKIHTDVVEAHREALRLAQKEKGCNVYVLETSYIYQHQPMVEVPYWSPLKVNLRSVK